MLSFNQVHLGNKDSPTFTVAMRADITRTCGVELLHLVSGMNGLKVTLSPGRRGRDTDRHFLNTVEGGTPGTSLKICWDKRLL